MQAVDGWLEDTYPTHSTQPEMVVMVVHSLIIHRERHQIDILLPALLPQAEKDIIRHQYSDIQAL